MSKELGLPGCFWFLKTTVIAIEHQVRVRVFAGARPALGPSVEFKEGSESPTPAELQQAGGLRVGLGTTGSVTVAVPVTGPGPGRP